MKSKVLSILLDASVFMLSSCKAAKVLNDESVKAPEMSSEETTEATTAAATNAATEEMTVTVANWIADIQTGFPRLT